MKTDRRNKAEQLASRPYVIEAQPSETTDGAPSWVAYVMELNGCIGQGETKEEAIADVKLAMVDFIETMLEYEMHVPAPKQTPTVSTGSKAKVVKVEQPFSSDELTDSRHVRQLAYSPAA